jgi:hypothetical protein
MHMGYHPLIQVSYSGCGQCLPNLLTRIPMNGIVDA